MAVFRKIHVSFWSDPFVESLDISKKLFYLYLLTNERTQQCGIYEISIKKMSTDTGFSVDEITSFLNFFKSKGKLTYSLDTQEIALKNWGKYNESESPKVYKCIQKELKTVKNRVLIQYIYSMDTKSQEEEEKEQEKEEEKERKIESNGIKLESWEKAKNLLRNDKVYLESLCMNFGCTLEVLNTRLEAFLKRLHDTGDWKDVPALKKHLKNSISKHGLSVDTFFEKEGRKTAVIEAPEEINTQDWENAWKTPTVDENWAGYKGE